MRSGKNFGAEARGERRVEVSRRLISWGLQVRRGHIHTQATSIPPKNSLTRSIFRLPGKKTGISLGHQKTLLARAVRGTESTLTGSWNWGTDSSLNRFWNWGLCLFLLGVLQKNSSSPVLKPDLGGWGWGEMEKGRENVTKSLTVVRTFF